ncbi:MAG: leucyl/phenylalanyl-tRNA--protein transferase [Acidimicrobiia bacterium]
MAPLDKECIAAGADLAPATLVAAYRRGLFPMRVERGVLGWWSPNPRGVLPLDGFIVHRSLARAERRFEIRIDSEFVAVMRACGDPARPHGWIDESFVAAYTELFTMGWAHSVEAWRDDILVGGVYGIAIGAFFAGESMFHLERDASKVALHALVEHLRTQAFTLFDVQWTTPHLRSLGAQDVLRHEYLDLLDRAVTEPTRWSA